MKRIVLYIDTPPVLESAVFRMFSTENEISHRDIPLFSVDRFGRRLDRPFKRGPHQKLSLCEEVLQLRPTIMKGGGDYTLVLVLRGALVYH